MKKILSLIILLMFMGVNVQAASFKTAIAKYKAGNFTGCINELDKVSDNLFGGKDSKQSVDKLVRIMAKYDIDSWKEGDRKSEEEALKMFQEIRKEVPRFSIDKWAYLFYYYALCYHQLGIKNLAKANYGAAMGLTWESKSQIYLYSKQAATCLEKPDSCQSSDMDEFIKSGKQVSDDIIKEELKRNLQKHQQEINAGKDLSALPEENEKLAWVDSGISPEVADFVTTGAAKTQENIPTDEEIGKAVRTLQRAGINPMNYMNGYNNEYAQLNALFNDGNSNYNTDYATMMMMNGSKNMSPQLMQTLMQQQMMGGFGL